MPLAKKLKKFKFYKGFNIYDELIKENTVVIKLERQIDTTKEYGCKKHWGYIKKNENRYRRYEYQYIYYIERFGSNYSHKYYLSPSWDCDHDKDTLACLINYWNFGGKRLNKIQILERYEFFLKCHQMIWPYGEDPYGLLRKIYRVINSFSLFRINLEELCKEAFKPERVMYQLSFNPDYS